VCVHKCTLSVIAYYTQPNRVYYTLPGVHILHSWHKKWTKILLVHSYIDSGFVFSYPLSVIFEPAQPASLILF
jgi:hypothetical protein